MSMQCIYPIFKNKVHTSLRIIVGLIAGSLLFSATPGWSTVLYNFDFSSPTGSLGTSQTYSNNGVTITAYGYNQSGNLTNLYGKNDGGDETGLGIKNESDHEIPTNQFVQLDLSQLWTKNPTSLMMSIGSVQSGEGWNIYEATAAQHSAGQIGTLIQSGNTDYPDTFSINPIPTSFPFLSIRASEGDVLLVSLSAQAVSTPEPATLLLMSSGLAWIAFRKKHLKK